MERQFKPNNKCALMGCNNTALNGIHCTQHSISQQQNGSGNRQSSGPSFTNSTFRPAKSNVLKDSRDPSGSTRPEERSRTAPFKSNLPPDLLSKHGMTARKSISSSSPSKKRADVTSGLATNASLQKGHAQPPPFLPSSSAINSVTNNGYGRQPQSFISQPQMNTDQALSGSSVRNGAQPNGSAGINGQNQRRSGGADSGSKEPIRTPRPSSHAAQSSQSSVTANGVGNGVLPAHNSPGRPTIRHQKSTSRETNPPASSASPSRGRDFRSLPIVRTNFRPPVEVKPAPATPSISSSAGKRKRDTSSDSSSSTSEESDEDDAMRSPRPSTGPQHAEPVQTGVSKLLYQGVAASPMAESEAGTQAAAIQNGLVNNLVHSHAPNSQNQRNVVPDRNGTSSFAPDSSFLTSGPNGLEGVRGDPHEGVQNDETHLPTESQHQRHAHPMPCATTAAKIQRLLPGTEPRRSRAHDGKKMSNEERRLQLCASFDSAKFDAMLYGQDEAASPPEGVFIPAAPVYPQSAPTPGENHRRDRLFMKLDPRIHWPHKRSEQWHVRKMEEIKARGGRKANFGKAASRMREQRLAEERRVAARAAEEAAAAREAQSLPSYNPPEPWSHHRPMDFTDVPDKELPKCVRKNPEWMKAVKWMRQCREDSMGRNEEAAALQAAGKPWKHLFPNLKNGR